MKEIPLTPTDSTFTYSGRKITMSNIKQNPYTNTWTFDLSWGTSKVVGIPITGGTNVVKGNGTPFVGLIFLDYSQTTGEVVNLDETHMFILEEGD